MLDKKFRANLAYELVEFGCLSETQQEQLRPLTKDPDVFGVLKPRAGANLPIKTVCQRTALLFLFLNKPGMIPVSFRHSPSDTNRALAELVLDSVLSVEHAGEFLTGANAAAVLGAYKSHPEDNPAAKLATDALQSVSMLGIKDIRHLAIRLYCYNRLPISPSWRQRYPSDEAVMRELGIFESSPVSHLLSHYWIFDSTNVGWLTWRSVHQQLDTIANGTHKLYFSPAPDSVFAAFADFVRAMTEAGASCFKVGKGLAGILRPDKIVAYFPGREELARAAEKLFVLVKNYPPHGVPFTATFGGNLIISWGIDPPAHGPVLPWLRHESWRTWIVTRLAEALTQSATVTQQNLKPWQFALERIQIAGVDPSTWIPSSAIWDR